MCTKHWPRHVGVTLPSNESHTAGRALTAAEQVYASLPDGSYTFSAIATNAAGVAAASPVQHGWTVALPQFAQITASPAAAATSAANFTSQQTVAFAAYSTSGQTLTSMLQARCAGRRVQTCLMPDPLTLSPVDTLRRMPRRRRCGSQAACAQQTFCSSSSCRLSAVSDRAPGGQIVRHGDRVATLHQPGSALEFS